uniref:Uncharacterized protein n=1 Tax=Arundo donax TaxID=35708 RepID=A0A0A9BRB5_ARUDO
MCRRVYHRKVGDFLSHLGSIPIGSTTRPTRLPPSIRA